MEELILFVGGMVFGLIIMPILDAIGTWLQNLFGLQSVKLQAKAAQVGAGIEEENENARAVGFQISDTEFDEEEDDE